MTQISPSSRKHCIILFKCLGPLRDFVAFVQWVGRKYDVSKFMSYGGVKPLKCECQ